VQKKYSDSFVFGGDICFSLFTIVLLTMTFTAAEVYASNGHMLADIEIANGCAPCSISMD
jgi:hypothetical protein